MFIKDRMRAYMRRFRSKKELRQRILEKQNSMNVYNHGDSSLERPQGRQASRQKKFDATAMESNDLGDFTKIQGSKMKAKNNMNSIRDHAIEEVDEEQIEATKRSIKKRSKSIEKELVNKKHLII